MHFVPELLRQKDEDTEGKKNEKNEEGDKGESVLSKHTAIEGDLPTSPNNFIIERNKCEEECEGECEDVSVANLSQKEVMIGQMKAAVDQVAKSSKQGNHLSMSIMEEMDPIVLKKLRSSEKKKKNSFEMA